jgi:hypothetical protein
MHATGYYGLAACTLCRQTRVHCFSVDEVILPCPRCDREIAFDTGLGKQTACPHCHTSHALPSFPRTESRQILVCYACLRAGQAAIDRDTFVGIVAWEPAQSGHTMEMPIEPAPESNRDATAPILLAGGTSAMLPTGPEAPLFPIGPRGPLYAAAAARYGFEHVIVARRPFEPGRPDRDWEAVRVPQAQLFELLRTPSYGTWQGEHWLFCCQQPMVYLGDWSTSDFERHAGEGKGRALFDVVVPDAGDWLWGHRGAGINVFRCLVCGQLDSHWDFD